MDGANRVHCQDQGFGPDLARFRMLIKLRKKIAGEAVRDLP